MRERGPDNFLNNCLKKDVFQCILLDEVEPFLLRSEKSLITSLHQGHSQTHHIQMSLDSDTGHISKIHYKCLRNSTKLKRMVIDYYPGQNKISPSTPKRSRMCPWRPPPWHPHTSPCSSWCNSCTGTRKMS